MSEICFELSPGPQQSLADLCRAFVWGPARAWLLPALPMSAIDPANELWPGESLAFEGYTQFEGPSLAPAVIDAAQQGEQQNYACALTLTPMMGRHALIRRRRPEQALEPLCTLRLTKRGLQIALGAFAHALLTDPATGAPTAFAAELSEALSTLEATQATVELSGQVYPRLLDRLAAQLNLPNLKVVHATEVPARTSLTAGHCLQCRHANQGTIDLTMDGLLACSLAGSRYGVVNATCEVTTTGDGPVRYAYEPYDGLNGTWGLGLPLRFAD